MTSFFRNCNIFFDWAENQIRFGSDVSNSGNKLNMFKNRRMLFIHLDINSLLPTIKKMCHLAELTNSSLKGISETKLDGSVLNSEIATGRVMILSG